MFFIYIYGCVLLIRLLLVSVSNSLFSVLLMFKRLAYEVSYILIKLLGVQKMR